MSADHPLWEAVTDAYELAEHELVLLGEACRTAVLCDELQDRLDDDGPLLKGKDGPRVHPAAVELRQQRIVLARLLVALRIPTDDEGEVDPESGRTQRRGVRGVYGMGL